MKKSINDIVLSAIRNSIRNEKEIIPSLMSFLNIGRQSVYRRLRGEIPFSFEEIATISVRMGFSLDELINHINDNNDIYQENTSNKKKDFPNLYADEIYRIASILENVRKYKDVNIITTSNRLPYISSTSHLTIAKLGYYKWFFQKHDDYDTPYFRDFILPSNIVAAIKNVIYNYKKIEKQTVILDYNILKPLLKEVCYYYKRDLLSENDFQLLQEEFLGFLDSLEMMAIKGYHSSGIKLDIYLSNINIESNCSLLEYDCNRCLQLWINSVESIISFNKDFCNAQYEWIRSLKKYSTLITQCNDYGRTHFFKKQRELVMNLRKKNEVFIS